MRRLLELGQLAAIINGTLFVHGGVCSGAPYRDGSHDCLGYVPRDSDHVVGATEAPAGHVPPERYSDATRWVEALNGWCCAQVRPARPRRPQSSCASAHARARAVHSL